MHTAHSKLHTVQDTLHPHFIIHTAHININTSQCKLDNTHINLTNANCTHNTSQSTLHTVHYWLLCTLFILQVTSSSLSVSMEDYYTTHTDIFSLSAHKSKIKVNPATPFTSFIIFFIQCELCSKVIETGRLMNHVKYFHNFSNWSLIEAFTVHTNLNFDFSTNNLTLVSR